MRIEIHGTTINDRIVDQAVDILRNGGLIIYPTDTVYGLGCDITQKSAIERIYRVKGMEKQKPLSFVCADIKDISKYAKISTVMYRDLRKYLPGPYTFILPGTKEVPKALLSKQKTVGVRIPDHALTLAIVRALGNPIISTSVNIIAKNFASDPQEFSEYYEGQVDLILDSGPTWAELSSVIDMTDDDHPIVIREGQGDVSWCLI
ncbi:MAG: threonylcarbamoyl-AMP synthase [Candidatus Marinimicrobia bacterium]|nr:threonylcarbamoyl-AMP synthase [Candidatus Neomarinimicrobiota bacterium]MCF7923294.1 threonylcarbamoyl-AMP synthase [Candidatus Neomarinimicrobiota bacterium]